ncbi:MAG: oxygen-independent coproporphyrinogen III oxidase-like protein, partial [Rhodocyclaceae bacterium]|nr:oxygen-independent coproporphyrinogen III oxidase-like protein [Rhodocyclaceae bacterium]
RHNLNYWQFGDYLGIGAGAHGKLSFPDRIVREARPRHPRDYLAAAASPAQRARGPVNRSDLPFEFMMNALRLNEGVPASLFPERTGLGLGEISARLAEGRAEGLLSPAPDRIAPTERGRRFLNALLHRFLPA